MTESERKALWRRVYGLSRKLEELTEIVGRLESPEPEPVPETQADRVLQQKLLRYRTALEVISRRTYTDIIGDTWFTGGAMTARDALAE